MSIQRIIIDVDLSKLSFAEQHGITGAIATLQRYATTPYMHLEVSEVAGVGRTGPRNPRADRKAIDERVLQPQTKIVFDCLKQAGRALTPQEIAAETGIGENSVRGQLNTLWKRGLATSQKGKPKPWSLV
jgi:hypothetical protein